MSRALWAHLGTATITVSILGWLWFFIEHPLALFVLGLAVTVGIVYVTIYDFMRR